MAIKTSDKPIESLLESWGGTDTLLPHTGALVEAFIKSYLSKIEDLQSSTSIDTVWNGIKDRIVSAYNTQIGSGSNKQEKDAHFLTGAELIGGDNPLLRFTSTGINGETYTFDVDITALKETDDQKQSLNIDIHTSQPNYSTTYSVGDSPVLYFAYGVQMGTGKYVDNDEVFDGDVMRLANANINIIVKINNIAQNNDITGMSTTTIYNVHPTLYTDQNADTFVSMKTDADNNIVWTKDPSSGVSYSNGWMRINLAEYYSNIVNAKGTVSVQVSVRNYSYPHSINAEGIIQYKEAAASQTINLTFAQLSLDIKQDLAAINNLTAANPGVTGSNSGYPLTIPVEYTASNGLSVTITGYVNGEVLTWTEGTRQEKSEIVVTGAGTAKKANVSFNIPLATFNANKYQPVNIQIFATAQITATDILRSELFFFDVFRAGVQQPMICYFKKCAAGTLPIINYNNPTFDAEQFDTFSIQYCIHDPNTEIGKQTILTSTQYQNGIAGDTNTISIPRRTQTKQNRLKNAGNISNVFSYATMGAKYSASNTRSYFVNVSESATIDLDTTNETPILYLDAEGRSNTEINKDSWVYGDYKASFNAGFTWSYSNTAKSGNGWTGNALKLTNGAIATINFPLMAEASNTSKPFIDGFTFEIEFKVENRSMIESDMIYCYWPSSAGIQGLYISTEYCGFYTGGITKIPTDDVYTATDDKVLRGEAKVGEQIYNEVEAKLGSFYPEGEWYQYTIVFDNESHILGDNTSGYIVRAFLNGIMVACDTMARIDTVNPATTFNYKGVEKNSGVLTIDSTGADVYVKNIRAYAASITSDQALDMYIMDRDEKGTGAPEEKDTIMKLYNANNFIHKDTTDNYNYKYNGQARVTLDIDRIKADGRGVLVVCNESDDKLCSLMALNSSSSKKDYITGGHMWFYSQFGASHNFEAEPLDYAATSESKKMIRIQGTTSTLRPRKNYRFYFGSKYSVAGFRGCEELGAIPLKYLDENKVASDKNTSKKGIVKNNQFATTPASCMYYKIVTKDEYDAAANVEDLTDLTGKFYGIITWSDANKIKQIQTGPGIYDTDGCKYYIEVRYMVYASLKDEERIKINRDKKLQGGKDGKYKWRMNDTVLPEYVYTIKSDFVDSSMVHNTGGAKLFNQMMTFSTNNDNEYIFRTQAQNSEAGHTYKATNTTATPQSRHAVDGYPFDIFQADSVIYEEDGLTVKEFCGINYLGQFNFNLDKSKSGDSYGFDSDNYAQMTDLSGKQMILVEHLWEPEQYRGFAGYNEDGSIKWEALDNKNKILVGYTYDVPKEVNTISLGKHDIMFSEICPESKWISLYNTTNTPLNLNGLTITKYDEKGVADPYTFNTDIIIKSHECYKFICGGKDGVEGALANFGLSGKKLWGLKLSDINGNVSDEIKNIYSEDTFDSKYEAAITMVNSSENILGADPFTINGVNAVMVRIDADKWALRQLDDNFATATDITIEQSWGGKVINGSIGIPTTIAKNKVKVAELVQDDNDPGKTNVTKKHFKITGWNGEVISEDAKGVAGNSEQSMYEWIEKYKWHYQYAPVTVTGYTPVCDLESKIYDSNGALVKSVTGCDLFTIENIVPASDIDYRLVCGGAYDIQCIEYLDNANPLDLWHVFCNPKNIVNGNTYHTRYYELTAATQDSYNELNDISLINVNDVDTTDNKCYKKQFYYSLNKSITPITGYTQLFLAVDGDPLYYQTVEISKDDFDAIGVDIMVQSLTNDKGASVSMSARQRYTEVKYYTVSNSYVDDEKTAFTPKPNTEYYSLHITYPFELDEKNVFDSKVWDSCFENRAPEDATDFFAADDGGPDGVSNNGVNCGITSFISKRAWDAEMAKTATDIMPNGDPSKTTAGLVVLKNGDIDIAGYWYWHEVNRIKRLFNWIAECAWDAGVYIYLDEEGTQVSNYPLSYAQEIQTHKRVEKDVYDAAKYDVYTNKFSAISGNEIPANNNNQYKAALKKKFVVTGYNKNADGKFVESSINHDNDVYFIPVNWESTGNIRTEEDWNKSFVSAKFTKEYNDYLMTENMLAWYVWTDYIMSVDQRAKNMMMVTYDGLHWGFQYYDGDTCLGVRNDCYLAYDFTLDYSYYDQGASQWGFQGHYSWLWMLIRANLNNTLKSVAQTMRNGSYFSDKAIITMFNTEQCDKWSAREFNYSQEYRYIQPYCYSELDKEISGTTPVNQAVTYLMTAQGDRKSHRTYTLNKRGQILDGKYLAGAWKTVDAVTIVGSENPDTNYFKVVTGVICYCSSFKSNLGATQYYYNTPTTEYNEIICPDGSGDKFIGNYSGYTTVVPEKRNSITFAGNGANNAYQIAGLSNAIVIDMTECNISATTQFTIDKCSSLQVFIANNCTAGGPNKNISYTKTGEFDLTSINNCTALEYISIYNTTLGNSKNGLDISSLSKLKYLDIRGTNMTILYMPKGGSIRTMKLNALQGLYMTNLIYLTNDGFSMESYDNLSSFVCDGCVNFDYNEILNAFINNSVEKKAIRITNVNMTVTKEWLKSLYNYTGYDENWNPTTYPVIEGTVYLDKYIEVGNETKEGTLKYYQARFGQGGLTICEPEYTVVAYDLGASDNNRSIGIAATNNIINMDNETGYGTGNKYVPSAHITAVTDQIHRYMGKITSIKNTKDFDMPLDKAITINDTVEGGTETYNSLPCLVGSENQMTIYQLKDTNSQYYEATTTEKVAFDIPASTSETNGTIYTDPSNENFNNTNYEGEVFVKIPHFWYKGVLDFGNSSKTNTNKFYYLISSNEECPAATTNKVVNLSSRDVWYNNKTMNIADGRSAENTGGFFINTTGVKTGTNISTAIKSFTTTDYSGYYRYVMCIPLSHDAAVAINPELAKQYNYAGVAEKIRIPQVRESISGNINSYGKTGTENNVPGYIYTDINGTILSINKIPTDTYQANLGPEYFILTIPEELRKNVAYVYCTWVYKPEGNQMYESAPVISGTKSNNNITSAAGVDIKYDPYYTAPVIVHFGLSSGDQMTTSNVSSWISDFEPDWCENRQFFVGYGLARWENASRRKNLHIDVNTSFTPTISGGEADETQHQKYDYIDKVLSAAHNRGLALMDYEQYKNIVNLYKAYSGANDFEFDARNTLSRQQKKNMGGAWTSGHTIATGLRDTEGNFITDYGTVFGIEKFIGSGSRCNFALERSAYCGSWQNPFIKVIDTNKQVRYIRRPYWMGGTNSQYSSAGTEPGWTSYLVYNKYCDLIRAQHQTGTPDKDIPTQQTYASSMNLFPSEGDGLNNYTMYANVANTAPGFFDIAPGNSGSKNLTTVRLVFNGTIKTVASVKSYRNTSYIGAR